MRISTRTTGAYPESPRHAYGASRQPLSRAALVRASLAHRTKCGHRRRTAPERRVAARGRAKRIQACQGGKEAHAVSGWRVAQDARAHEMDGLAVGGGFGAGAKRLSGATCAQRGRRAGHNAHASRAACANCAGRHAPQKRLPPSARAVATLKKVDLSGRRPATHHSTPRVMMNYPRVHFYGSRVVGRCGRDPA